MLTRHPYRLAVEDGCTHVLSLGTRPVRPPRERLSVAQRYRARHLDSAMADLDRAGLRHHDLSPSKIIVQ